mgnify:CR=1 FL=1|jgi:hypothetical protein
MRYWRKDGGQQAGDGPENDPDGQLLDHTRSMALSGADFCQLTPLVKLYRARRIRRTVAKAARFLFRKRMS